MVLAPILRPSDLVGGPIRSAVRLCPLPIGGRVLEARREFV